jgi:Ca-activated chloride channel family protein
VSKTPTEFKLEELARAADVSPRTVRYYVQRGLLPAPTFRAKDTAYDGKHLLLLQAIKKLQEAFLPLDAIAVTLANADDASLRAIANGTKPVVGKVHVHAPPSRNVEKVERHVLAEGVELLVSDHANAQGRALVEEILKLIQHGGKR